MSMEVMADPFGIPALTVTTQPDGSENYTVTIQILMLMTLMSLLPAMLMMMTAFTRILIVFTILRQAMGLQQAPSNQILIGLALFLTFYVMTPVIEQINAASVIPYMNEEISTLQAVRNAEAPLRSFMLKQTRRSDLALFVRLSGSEKDVDSADDLNFTVIVPAFITSELKTAFQIGFLFFIPFLIIDMVVASILMAMGMMMLSPLIISLPFKILLFVMIDGWAMVVGTVASSFGDFS
ncbi:MAG: flagellar biosynthetic protein FliP [Gammaproteobacteria bacterium]|nr:MAG: flagellar biosynthetic protein FliP [Gammaproteobacteria bacterium]